MSELGLVAGIGVLLLVLLGIRFVQQRSLRSRQKLRRLAALQSGKTKTPDLALLIEEAAPAGGPGGVLRAWNRLRRLVTQALPGLSPMRALLAVAGSGVASLAIVMVMLDGLALQLVAALALWGGGLAAMLQRRRSQRIAAALAQLPAALEILVRSIESGHPLLAALKLVGREMPEPIGPEFSELARQLTFGAPLASAVGAMTDRLGVDELNLFGVTLTVQAQTGGKLSEVLRNLAEVIRERVLMQAKIRAITAEGRMSALIMIIFPFVLFSFVRLIMPAYFDPLWDSGYGPATVVLVITLMTLGVTLLLRIVRVDY